jgi:uncharacterized Ntn-hydrolase superfamily protein
MKRLKKTERKELNQLCSMESRIFRFAQQTMENMAHLMEERHDIVMSHQSRFLRSGFRQIGDHRSQRIVACIVWKVITSQERPDSSMRIFCIYSVLLNGQS